MKKYKRPEKPKKLQGKRKENMKQKTEKIKELLQMIVQGEIIVKKQLGGYIFWESVYSVYGKKEEITVFLNPRDKCPEDLKEIGYDVR